MYIVRYHYTRDLEYSRYPKIKALDYDLFDRQLSWFRKNYNVITMEQVLEALDGGSQLTEKDVLLTFDDGYIDNFTVALPLLKKHHMQGSFFIPAKTFTENSVLDVNKIHFLLASVPIAKVKDEICHYLDLFKNEGHLESKEELYERYGKSTRFASADENFIKKVLQTGIDDSIRNQILKKMFEEHIGVSEECFARELYMNYDQIQFMKYSGMFIGLHGYDHFWLANLEKNKMMRDIEKALEAMESFIDLNSWVMNYPYGNYSEEVISYISEHGCKMGLTTEDRTTDIAKDNPYKLPRLDCNDFPPKSENYKEFEK